jgi:pimeloyl-ACP methyl ester carboxylesterase
MGTCVAEQIAIERPERVSKLVLAGAPGPPAGNPLIAEAADAVAGLEDPIDPEFVREFQASTTERPLPPGRLDTFVAESLKLPARVWRAAFAGLLDMDVSAGLRRIEQPVLLLHGARNGLVPLRSRTGSCGRFRMPASCPSRARGTRRTGRSLSGSLASWRRSPERPLRRTSRRRPGGPSGSDLRRPGEGRGRGSLDSP